MIIEYSFSIQFQNVCIFFLFFLEARRKLWWTQRNILVNSQSCSIKIMYQYKTNLTGTSKRKIFSYSNYDELPVLYVVYFDISANSIQTFQLFAFL